MNTYKARVVIFKPICAARARNGIPSANHVPLIAKPSSCHVHSTLCVTPPTSHCATLVVTEQGRRESRGGPGKAFMREARKNIVDVVNKITVFDARQSVCLC